MLSKFLRAAARAKGIQYVGGYVEGLLGSTNNITVTLTSLTGGLATQPAAGDFVIVYFGIGAPNNNKTPVISGYTELVLLKQADTESITLLVAHKFMTGTPDTSITLINGTENTADAGAVYISVWRNVNTTTPFDVTQTTSQSSNSVLANPPAITPVTTGAIIVAGGAGAHNRGVQTYSSSDLTGFLSAGGDDSNNATIGGGYNVWTSGSFDPAQFTFSSTDSTNFSRAAVTLALRPA